MSDNINIYLADTAESQYIHYRLRYLIYCHQKGFEPINPDLPDLEIDAWDSHSVPFIAKQTTTSNWSSTVRLIKPSDTGLPTMKKYQDVSGSWDIPISETGEISRLCQLSQVSTNKKLTFHLLLSLAYYAWDKEINYLLFQCHPGLKRLMTAAGFPITELPYSSKSVQSVRKPYIVSIRDMQHSDTLSDFFIPQSTCRPYKHYSRRPDSTQAQKEQAYGYLNISMLNAIA